MADVGTTTTRKAGDEAILSAKDKATMNKLTEQWNAATAAGNTALADSIHEQAEAIRAGYGYSGGADGSGIYAVKTPQQQVMQQQVQQNGAADMQKYLEDMYAAQADAAMKQLEDAYNKNMTALDVAEGKIPKAYEAARNRTAGESAVAGANFNEYAAAQGLGSGSGTQAQLARANALSGNLSSINAQEANALADIEAERAELMRSYQSAITQAQSQNKAALADALYNEMLRLQQEYQNFSLQQQQWNYQLEQDAYQRQLNEAKLAAQYGDTSRLANMGIIGGQKTGSVYDYDGENIPLAGDPTGPAVNTTRVNQFNSLYGGLSDAEKLEVLENARFVDGTLTSSDYNALMNAWGFSR
jgi:hypothetical protein